MLKIDLSGSYSLSGLRSGVSNPVTGVTLLCCVDWPLGQLVTARVMELSKTLYLWRGTEEYSAAGDYTQDDINNKVVEKILANFVIV